MANIREYFDSDFSYALRVHVRLPFDDVEAVILYDFAGYKAFLACYIPSEHQLPYFLELLTNIEHGTPIKLDGRVTLPSTRDFPGQLQVENIPGVFEVRGRFHGDPGWMSTKDIQTSMPARVFIYSESDLTDDEIRTLKQEGLNAGHEVQFRSRKHAAERAKFETPLAFISHDSRDKEVARKIAINLQKMLCPVWYDEFSLKVGNNLRASIERGLKECQKCVIILSQNFFSNNGWTKREFDSIFTREILEEKNLVLPVWLEVSKQSVYNYSPSLLNIKGIDWASGEEEVCRQLLVSIMQ